MPAAAESTPPSTWSASQETIWDPELFAHITDLEWLAGLLVEGFLIGMHRSHLRGFSAEFAEYKSYTQGEDLRHLDWKALARLDRLYIRKFESETNLTALLLMDGSGSMAYASSSNVKPKHAYSSALAAALARLLLKQHDACGVAISSEQGIGTMEAPRSGPHHFHQLLATLSQATYSGDARLEESLRATGLTLKHPSQVILFTDGMQPLDGLEKELSLLRLNHHEVSLLQVLDPVEVDFNLQDSGIYEDMETGMHMEVTPEWIRESYLKALDKHQRKLREICHLHGVYYARIRTDEAPFQAMAGCLAQRNKLI